MIRMRKNFVLIERDQHPSEEKTENGIYLPSLAPKPPKNTGIVRAMGSGVEDLKIGDHVLFLQHAGQPLDHEGKSCVNMTEDQIVAII